MKTEQITSKVSSNIDNNSDFKIKATSKAFSILSSGLYSDKILAIVRELSCNAYDSHVEAGIKDVPFIIRLPNRLNPHFEVQDFGIGLDHKGVTELYTTYFESTKTDSNDYIGALGLGSKSPFSYVESFTVVARKDKKERIYTAYINESGVPSISLMGENDTTECNGVQVKMPVKMSDFNVFADKAKTALKYFNVKPDVKGVQDFKIIDEEIELSGKDWYITKDVYQLAKATQGNVVYPLNIDPIKDLTEEHRAILKLNIIIDFPIGDLEVAASREGLSYNKHTQDNIKKKIEDIHRELIEIFNYELDECKTEWEARKLISFLSHPNANSERRGLNIFYYTLYAFKNKLINWKGINLSEGHRLNIKLKDHPNINIRKMIKKSRSSDFHIVSNLHVDSIDILPHYVNRFYVDDIGCGFLMRIRQDVKDNFLSNNINYNEEIIIITHVDPKNRTDKQKNDAIKKFIKELGNPEIILASSIEYIKSAVVSEKYKTTPKVLRWLGKGMIGRSHYGKKNWSSVGVSENILDKKSGYYVPIERWSIIDNRISKENSSKIRDIINYAKDLKIIPEDVNILGVRKIDLAKFKANSKWINLFDEIERGTKRILKDKKTIMNIRIFNNISKSRTLLRNSFDIFATDNTLKIINNKITNKISKTSFFWKFMEKITCVKDKNMVYFEKYKVLSDFFNLKIGNVEEDKTFLVECEKFINRYEMLSFIYCSDIHYHDDRAEKIIRYIKYVDSNSKE